MFSAELKMLTWNIAAVNNNPFEYWITHPDEDYNKLMQAVEGIIVAAGDFDVPVGTVFTELMWAELKQLMVAQGWKGVEETEKLWLSDYSQRKIIADFMKDKGLGDKRLASMPDRATNMINTLDQGVIFRPTVISCFSGDMSTMPKWWAEWKKFMFEQKVEVPKKGGGTSKTLPCEMLTKIKKAKYPAIDEAEEEISIPLQMLCQAIFDAILLHMVNSVSPGSKWQQLKLDMLAALYSKKDDNTCAILDRTYASADIMFIQEATMHFADKAEHNVLGQKYCVLRPATPSAVNQNSLILLSKKLFDSGTATDVTEDAMAHLTANDPVSPGDLLLFTVLDNCSGKYMVGSFHGDTNGLATLAVLKAVDAVARAMPEFTLVFGLDANTHTKGSKKQQGVTEFAQAFVAAGYNSCWGATPDPLNYTTFNARTYLQAQLQKAVKSTDIDKDPTVTGAFIDKNPKDFILFRQGAFIVVAVAKDNTGVQGFVKDAVFPSMDFPSDHAITSTTLWRPPPPHAPRPSFTESPFTSKAEYEAWVSNLS
eukprot:CAMPEP_0119322314 /NCGR_PEP_ID=MMETSP1333-20130426/57818_1 /TAXON_ID=418940 /ORGANISM="Scyphosphaera apsteinii, Strain RCC1455" /LENGTH=537 /DNA_ID=CAMNT_0007329509 /DNA_START=125 /DNA_END=1738 /DNA_ORIENTATION=+